MAGIIFAKDYLRKITVSIRPVKSDQKRLSAGAGRKRKEKD